MIAVDTNIIVRILTADHAEQTAAARSLFAAETVWIAKTVILETAWVLGDLYGFDDTAVSEALRKVIGLPNVRIEDGQAVAAALALMASGLDFADALHLSGRPPEASFYSFDVKLVRRATRAGAGGVFLAGKL